MRREGGGTKKSEGRVQKSEGGVRPNVVGNIEPIIANPARHPEIPPLRVRDDRQSTQRREERGKKKVERRAVSKRHHVLAELTPRPCQMHPSHLVHPGIQAIPKERRARKEERKRRERGGSYAAEILPLRVRDDRRCVHIGDSAPYQPVISNPACHPERSEGSRHQQT